VLQIFLNLSTSPQNWLTSHKVIQKIKRVTFFLKHNVYIDHCINQNAVMRESYLKFNSCRNNDWSEWQWVRADWSNDDRWYVGMNYRGSGRCSICSATSWCWYNQSYNERASVWLHHFTVWIKKHQNKVVDSP